MFRNIIFMITFILLLGCSQDQPAPSTTQSTAVKAETPAKQNSSEMAETLLIFFINPDGGPCQMQERILNQMSADLEGKVTIRPVKTTVQSDMDIFYAYGIRALPTILLADSAGKEISRLPPGVHAAETIRGLLNQIPDN